MEKILSGGCASRRTPVSTQVERAQKPQELIQLSPEISGFVPVVPLSGPHSGSGSCRFLSQTPAGAAAKVDICGGSLNVSSLEAACVMNPSKSYMNRGKQELTEHQKHGKVQ